MFKCPIVECQWKLSETSINIFIKSNRRMRGAKKILWYSSRSREISLLSLKVSRITVEVSSPKTFTIISSSKSLGISLFYATNLMTKTERKKSILRNFPRPIKFFNVGCRNAHDSWVEKRMYRIARPWVSVDIAISVTSDDFDSSKMSEADNIFQKLTITIIISETWTAVGPEVHYHLREKLRRRH